MTTVPQTRCGRHAAMAAVGMPQFAAGYAGAVVPAGTASPKGAVLAGDSGNLAPIAWHTHLRSRNRVAMAVTPAA